ncbi:hypothetical protein [Azospirillum sp. SYSU D00513]|uniref:hypothetical protein n=1 Tax=Azospirillum sp. SYSU D00513 TaxID=2812561 RepID=UPI001A973E68|nr:hypothetical protein [Azospirillum sp. SYSU D00513]
MMMTGGEGRLSLWTMDDLTGPERALLCAVRQWFRTGTTGAMAAMRARLDGAGIPRTALLPLFAVLGGFAVVGVRRPEIGSPGDTRILRDEAALLDLLAAYQDGDEAEAADTLALWLPPLVCRMASANARQLAGLLGGSGIRMIRRRPLRIVALAAE